MSNNGKYIISNNDRVLMPFTIANTSNDNRILIPFMTPSHEMGMMDHCGQVIIEPKYDIICNDVYKESDLIVVGRLYPYGYVRKGGSVASYVAYRYGVVDTRGNIILELEYSRVLLGIDCDRITVQSFDNNSFCVYDTKGNTIVPYRRYIYIDGFDRGLARVKNNYWGIINADGEEVLPLTYPVIWNFYNKNRLSTYVEKERIGKNICFHDLDPSIPYPPDYHKTPKSNEYNNKEGYGRSYGEFAGSYAQDVMGFSDDVINDAFEGDPDNYWNID